MNRTIMAVVFWLALGVSALLLWEVVRSAHEGPIDEVSYSRFLSDVEAGSVQSVTITGQQIRGWFRDGRSFHLVGPSSPSVYLDTLRNNNVEIRFQDTQSGSLPMQLLGTWRAADFVGGFVVVHDPADATEATKSAGASGTGRRQFGAVCRAAILTGQMQEPQ